MAKDPAPLNRSGRWPWLHVAAHSSVRPAPSCAVLCHKTRTIRACRSCQVRNGASPRNGIGNMHRHIRSEVVLAEHRAARPWCQVCSAKASASGAERVNGASDDFGGRHVQVRGHAKVFCHVGGPSLQAKVAASIGLSRASISVALREMWPTRRSSSVRLISTACKRRRAARAL